MVVQKGIVGIDRHDIVLMVYESPQQEKARGGMIDCFVQVQTRAIRFPKASRLHFFLISR